MNLRDSERRGGPEPGQVKLVKLGGAEERKEGLGKPGSEGPGGPGRAGAAVYRCQGGQHGLGA